MEQFLIKKMALDSIGQCVDAVIEPQIYTKFVVNSSPRCGCGAGGTCASSCVSGCAERGGCGPYGPR